jgi:hypothetical protein
LRTFSENKIRDTVQGIPVGKLCVGRVGCNVVVELNEFGKVMREDLGKKD